MAERTDRRSRVLVWFVAVTALLATAGCTPRDSHIVRKPDNLREDRAFLSPPTLGHPIYACSGNVTVTNFLVGARLEVFIDGAPAPAPPVVGGIPEVGENIEVGTSFVTGQRVKVRQRTSTAVSGFTPEVMVTSHLDDYPHGLPQPRLFQNPIRQCGHAVLVEDTVPGATMEVRSENPAAGGGFSTPATVGQFNASTEWGLNWTGINPQLELGARVTAQARLCASQSAWSAPEIAVPPPDPMPAGSIASPIVEGQTTFQIWGAGGPNANDPPEHGPVLTALVGATPVGESAAPGGVPHLLGVSPAVAGTSYSATQRLCTPGPAGPPIVAVACSAMPASVIEPPLPGASTITVTTHQPGAEILVFANGQEIGHSGGSVINLSRPLADGETVDVVQRIGGCTGSLVYQIEVGCALSDDPSACGGDWPAFRHSGIRNGWQVAPSALADPYQVKTLEVKWTVAAPDGGAFRGSPVIWQDRVFIGSSAGRLFAFDANTGAELWRYPSNNEPPLTTSYTCNPSSEGIAASVAIARRRNQSLVILAAPDRTGRPSLGESTFGAGRGSGRLFALDAATGALVWATGDEVARLTGTTPGSTSELHEQLGYSAPLVLGNRIYVGVGDHCDNPIQNGRVVAVRLSDGALQSPSPFDFQATSTRGGGVWTYISGGLADGIFTTTGNTRNGNPLGEPSINHGLSMVRLNPDTGALEGAIQPVPFAKDDDPDWSAGASLMAASCGSLALSTQKDGWAYAANLGGPLSFRWQFPDTAFPFPASDPNPHGDVRYHRAGAVWNEVYVAMMGGEDVATPGSDADTYRGYQYLHALNACAPPGSRVRWIADLAPFTEPVIDAHGWGLGPPTVTGGIFFVGTNRGFLVALADPSVWPAQGSRCTMTGLSGNDCLAAGFQLVPVPTVLRSLDLGAGMLTRTEPAIARDSLYVASEGGRLMRIAPRSVR